MDAYDLHDGRFIQETSKTSAANAVTLDSDAVPSGKVWTVLSAAYVPDAAETKTVFFAILGRSTYIFPITFPVSIALSPTAPTMYPALTEGLEIKLFPGEKLRVLRDSATAGSTMILRLRYIETDLPYYSYEEPQNKVVAQLRKRGESTYRSSSGVPTGAGGSSTPPGGRSRGGGGTGELI